MPDVRIPLKNAQGKIHPSVIPDVPRFPNAVTAGNGKIPVANPSGSWDYIDGSSVGGGGAGGGSIASTRYNPAASTDKTVNSTALADVDAALLSVAFTAPASGKVQIDLCAQVKGSAANTRTFWALREGSAVIANSMVMVHEGTTPSRATASVIVTGLVAGQNYIYKWAAAASTGSTVLSAGGSTVDATTAGQATMVVSDAPFG